MKRKLFCSIIVTAALLLGSCAESIESQQAIDGKQTARNDSLPVAFDAYQNRSTRSGFGGVLTIEQLKETRENGGGFGVFAYYTDLKNYDQTYVPNFMYNRGVFYNSGIGIWEYSPIVYWPNEYGFDAASDDEDHLSFFAYAPYTPHVSAGAGSVADDSYGIVGFSRNTATGDPMVRYVASFDPAKSVDLCWGVVPADKTAWAKIQGGGTQTLAAGFPWLNIERPLETATQIGASSSSRIKFKFNHALAQLNVQIDTDADVTTHYDAGDELDPATKVYVRSISFTGVALQGALNLNNTVKDQALWLDWCGCTDLSYGQSVTVHDGRRDAREGVSGAEAANETPTGLNPNIIQNSTPTDGVIHTYQNLFKPTSPIAVPGSPTAAELQAQLEDAICVIPTGEAMTITIVYDIETENPKLASYLSDGKTHGVSIENKVTKTVAFGGVTGAGLQSNKRYTLKLHLGMNSVKFDADVSEWSDNTVNGEGWLPSNVRPIMLNQTVMYLGAPQSLTATTDPMGMPVTWTTSDASIVTLGGLAPARAGTRTPATLPGTWSKVDVTPVALGNATITAALGTGDKVVCDVHVVPIVLTSPSNTSPSNAIIESVGKKATVRLEASLFPATSAPSGVTWTASPAGYVTLTPVPGDPTKCDVTGDVVGTVTITAQNGTYPTTATCTMDVTSQPPTVTVPSLQPNWTYDTTTKDLLTTAGSVTGGTMKYSLDGSTWYTTFNDPALQKKDADSYTVYYKVDGDPGYDDVPATLIGTVLVSKATPTITLSATSATVYAKGVPTTFTASTSSAGEGATLSVSTTNGTASISSGTVTAQGGTAGSGTVTVTSPATTNYNAGTATFALTVNPKTLSLNPLSYVESTNLGVSYGTANSTWYDTLAGSSGYYLHNLSQYTAIAAQAASQNKHVPSVMEWCGIVPAYNNFNMHTASGNIVCYNVEIGSSTGTLVTLNDYCFADCSSYINPTGGDVYLVRYIGTDHCSVWKYHWPGTPSDYIEISSMLIDYIETQSQASTWLSANKASLTFSSSLSSTVRLDCWGYSNGSGWPGKGTGGNYLTTTAGTSGNTWVLGFGVAGGLGTGQMANTYHYSVRLFRDN